MKTLTAASENVVPSQHTINIVTMGKITHGKSIFIRSMSSPIMICNYGWRTNVTPKLDYTHVKIFKCENPHCERPGCYKSYKSGVKNPLCSQPGCISTMKVVRHVTFIDCMFNDYLMSRILNGSPIFDAAMLLISSKDPCPQIQTAEHLAAMELINLRNIFILQSKIDLVSESRAEESNQEIVKFVQGTIAEGAPIIPISSQYQWNLDVVCEYIANKIPIPIRDYSSVAKLIIIRSFDPNRPCSSIDSLTSGVVAGHIVKGVLKVGDEIEIRPGIISTDGDGRMICTPLFSKIVSLFTECDDLQYAVPGSLIGVRTKIDPSLCRANRLVGQVLGPVGTLPDTYISLEINFYLFRHLLALSLESSQRQSTIDKLRKGDTLMVSIGSASIGCRVTAIKRDLAKLSLITPVCAIEGEKISLSRRIQKNWRLIGWGFITKCEK